MSLWILLSSQCVSLVSHYHTTGNIFRCIILQMRDTQSIKVLISFGADINVLGFNGITALKMLGDCPHSKRKLQRLDSLLAIGCDDFTQQPTLGVTPEMVKGMLLSAGAEEKPVVEKKRFHASSAFAQSIYLASRAIKKPSSESLEIRYKYYYLLRDIIIRRLSNITDLHLSHSPEDSAYLLEHMKEVYLLQMAGSSILFLDGGGMRGLMQLEILCQVMSCYLLLEFHKVA